MAAGPIDDEAALEIALRLKALADPVRVKLVSLLFSADAGEVCSCDLAAAVATFPFWVTRPPGVCYLSAGSRTWRDISMDHQSWHRSWS